MPIDNVKRHSTHQPSFMQRYWQLLLLVVAAGTTYPIPYLRQNFENSMLDALGITQAQLGECHSLLGIMLFVTYVPSGWLADRVKPNRLLACSMAGTGVFALCLASSPSFLYVKLIFLGLGLTTGLTLWASLIRTTSLIATHDRQGQFFGLLESGRGVVEALLATLALALFAYSIEQQAQASATAVGRVFALYGLVAMGLSPLILFALRSPDHSEHTMPDAAAGTSTWVDFKALLSNPAIWLSTLIILVGYQMFWVTYSFAGLLETIFGIGAVTVGTITVARLWMRPISPLIAGFIGDRFNPTRFLAILMLLAAISLVSLPLLPSSASVTTLLAVVLIISLVTFGIRGIYWATLDHCNVSTRIRGLAIGFISILAYSPDIYVPMVQAWCLSTWPGKVGYLAYYGIFAASGVVGCVAALRLGALSRQNYSVPD